MLDKLLLLRKGEMIYGGMRGDAVNYFAQLGYTLPQEANPADFLIEIVRAPHPTASQLSSNCMRIHMP